MNAPTIVPPRDDTTLTTVSLHQLPISGTARLVEIKETALTSQIKLRLHELGLRTGELVTVTQRTAGNGRLISIGSMRYAVDKITAQAITVEHLH